MTKRSLTLPAEPSSVSVARAWVADVLGEIGRSDLVPSAQLGVSELVTNAILHARPPMVVTVGGTHEHPRVEVTDHSPGPLRPLTLATMGDADFPTTFGRGLAMVAMNAAAWGYETEDGGKRVWFEPAREMGEPDLSPIFHDDEIRDYDEVTAPPPDSVTVRLVNMPAVLFGHLRRYHFELRRELRLLSLAEPDHYPIAVRIGDAFLRADAERRAATGVARLDEAIADGVPSIDLEYAVPPSAPATMGLIHALFEECYEVFSDEHLLSLAPPEPLRDLQAWYFLEFVRQARNEAPRPWTGPLQLPTTESSRVTSAR